MDNNKNRIDIVNEVLEACILAYPVSSFVISLYKQYTTRGSLSKKQLQGLYSKAGKIEGFSVARLATLEALIKKMPTRFKSELPVNTSTPENNEDNKKMIEEILFKFPMHKRVLYLKSLLESNHPLTSSDIEDLKRFSKLAGNKKTPSEDDVS